MNFPTEFFKATTEFNTYEKHVNAPLIRKVYRIEGAAEARLLISGLGFYELFAGGRKITKGLLAPYISNPDDIVYFDEYNVTEFIEDGRLVLGIILGNGMQNAPGGRVWDFDIAKFRNAPCFAAALEVKYGDGRTEVYNADESFKTHPSPIIFDDLRSGCFYDANLEVKDWLSPDFDDSGWQNVMRAETPRGEPRICRAEPVVVTREVKPVKIYKQILCEDFCNRENMRLDTQYKFDFRGKEGVVFDFGVNTAGIFRLKPDCVKGQEIFIQFCEFETTEGRPSYLATGSFYPDGYGQTAYYIAKGEKDEIFEPAFCYMGYRYAVVFGLNEDRIDEDTLTMLVANSDIGERAEISCSDEIMNSLLEMGRVSDLANFYYFPTDCPHREKNGWTGDASVSCEHMLLRYKPEESLKEWLRNIVAAQAPDGALPGIIPTGGWGFSWGNGPTWDNVLTELPYQLLRLRDDSEGIYIAKDAMLRYLSYITEKIRPDGLICFGLGDWVQPGKAADQPTTPVYFTDTVMSMFIANKSALLFEKIGLTEQSRFASAIAKRLKKSIRKNLIDFGTMTAIPATQTAQAMLIYFGVFGESERAEAGRRLVEIIHGSDDHIACGMIGMRIVFHVLSDIGEGALAYKMITRTDFPSYGKLVKDGLTALPEDMLEDVRRNNPDSLNHHFLGDYQSWFLQRVVGIRINPRGSGCGDIDIAPDFVGELEFARGKYESTAGIISCEWKKTENDRFSLTIEIPEGVTGYVKAPKGFVFKCDNTYLSLNNTTCVPVKSGRSEFVTVKI